MPQTQVRGGREPSLDMSTSTFQRTENGTGVLSIELLRQSAKYEWLFDFCIINETLGLIVPTTIMFIRLGPFLRFSSILMIKYGWLFPPASQPLLKLDPSGLRYLIRLECERNFPGIARKVAPTPNT